MSSICSDFVRKLTALVCLLVLPAAAQQGKTALSVQAATNGEGAAAQGQSTGTPSGAQQPTAPMPNAPEPQKFPSPTGVDYSKPAPFLPNPFARYIPRQVPPPTFTNIPKLRELVQNGKIMLSLDDAVMIALADNMDIAISRYNLSVADTDILRTKSGVVFQGTPTGIVQNTIGGGVGGIGSGVTGTGAGGTSAGAGGAGAGAGGLVTSANGGGPLPFSFDPLITGTFSIEHLDQLQNFALLSGTAFAQQNTTTGDLTYTQGFSPGTQLNVGFVNTRIANNNPGVRFNPAVSSTFRATVTQHLLWGFGPSLNTRFIRQARNNKKITQEAFRLQVITTVSQIENIYWDLVNAYEDFKVKTRALELAQKTLSDNKKQVEIGTLAPLDVVKAESQVASAQQDLIGSKTALETQQLTIKNALTRSLPTSSQVMQMDVIPTDTVQIPDQENLPSVEEMISLALARSPGYNQQKINLQNAEITRQGVNNGLLPIIDLQAWYQGMGLNGVQNRLGSCPPQPVTPGCLPPGAFPATGFTDAFGNMFNSTAPDKGVAINIQIPLANRTAQALQARAQLEYRQSQLLIKQSENLIAIGIRFDAFTLEQARARVAAAQQAQILAQQTLDAEQKKYNLGASTYLNILTDESALSSAQSNLVSAMTNYAKARVQLDKDTAQTLEHLNIKLDEAVTGNIKTEPNVPGTVVNKKALQELMNPTPLQQQQPPPQPPNPLQQQQPNPAQPQTPPAQPTPTPKA